MSILIDVLLVDPYRKEVLALTMVRDRELSRELLRARQIKGINISLVGATYGIDMWFDAQHLTNDPRQPGFLFTPFESARDPENPEVPICGYALVVGARNRVITDLTQRVTPASFIESAYVAFEPWQTRLREANYIDHLTRNLELEFGGRVKLRPPSRPVERWINALFIDPAANVIKPISLEHNEHLCTQILKCQKLDICAIHEASDSPDWALAFDKDFLERQPLQAAFSFVPSERIRTYLPDDDGRVTIFGPAMLVGSRDDGICDLPPNVSAHQLAMTLQIHFQHAPTQAAADLALEFPGRVRYQPGDNTKLEP